MTKIADLLLQAAPTLTAGDYLVAHTRSESFVPSFKDTMALHKGNYLFKLVGVGAPDVDGNFAALNVVPVVKAEDGKSFVDDVANPIIVQTAGNVKFITGRNDNNFRDGYQDRHVVNKDVTVGTEVKELLAAFVDFAAHEFSLGVNEFTVEGPDYTEA
jgi:hypothetical protein